MRSEEIRKWRLTWLRAERHSVRTVLDRVDEVLQLLNTSDFYDSKGVNQKLRALFYHMEQRHRDLNTEVDAVYDNTQHTGMNRPDPPGSMEVITKQRRGLSLG